MSFCPYAPYPARGTVPPMKKKIKAMVCRQWGGADDLRLEEIERPALEPGQVRIQVRAAGVSFAMSLVIAGKYQRQPPLPFAPGSKATGSPRHTPRLTPHTSHQGPSADRQAGELLRRGR